MNDIKFEINKNKFYDALQIVNRCVSSTSPVPCLTGIKIEAIGSCLVLTGSDATTSTQVTLNNELDENLDLIIEKEGIICIEAKYLLDIVRKIDANTVYVSLIDGTLVQFKGHKADYKINGYIVEDYPKLEFDAPNDGIDIPSNIFKEIIYQTAFATSVKDQRPVLTGIHFKADGSNLIATATDSYRLARKKIALESEPFECTVPVKALNEAKTIFGDDELIHMSLDGKKIQFRNDTTILQSTLLEGRFPDTDRLIPSEFTSKLVISRDDFVRCIDRSMFIKTDNLVCLHLEIFNKDMIKISTESQEIGSFHETLVGKEYDGEPFSVSFSGGFMNDAARSFDNEEICLNFTSELRPIIVTSNDDDQSNLQLILPIRSFN